MEDCEDAALAAEPGVNASAILAQQTGSLLKIAESDDPPDKPPPAGAELQ